MDASVASCFIAATMPSGSERELFRSRMTSDGGAARISVSAASADRANRTATPSCLDVEPQPPIDEFYGPGEVIAFGNYEARSHHTPGHCPGGVCLQIGRVGEGGKDLFVGDTLFAGSIGRTDLPGGDYNTLIASIRNVLFAFGDDAIVHPGHGPATTIGRERKSNPFLVATLG